MDSLTKLFRRSLSFIGGFCCLCGLVVFSGCVETVETEIPEDLVKIGLRLDQAFQEKAYVRLWHDGAQEDYWFYILTEDMDTDAAELLAAEIAGSLATTGEVVGNVGTNKNIT